METQGALNLLFRSGLRRDFRDNFNEHETQYTQYLRVGSMDSPEVEATIIAGLRRLLEIGDGEPVTVIHGAGPAGVALCLKVAADIWCPILVQLLWCDVISTGGIVLHR